MIDITSKGFKELRTLKSQSHGSLSRFDRAKLRVLHFVWDKRELAGDSIDPLEDDDIRTLARSLTRQNPTWNYVPTVKLVRDVLRHAVLLQELEEL